MASNAAYRSAKAAKSGCERNATPDSPLFVAIAPGCGRDRETALARKRRPRIASDPGHVRGQIVAHRDTKPHYTTNADALVRWFESGVGHCVWRKVHREHPHVLGPTLLPRRQDDKSNVAGRKRARSTGPVWPTQDNGGGLGHGRIKASKVRLLNY